MSWRLHHHNTEILDPARDFPTDLVDPSLIPEIRSVETHRYPGQPFVLDETGAPESLINTFFDSRHFRAFSPGTRKRYAHSTRVWLEFCSIMGIPWIDASPDTISDFKYWRMTDSRNASRITGGSFHCDLAALSALYQWVGPRYGINTPILRREATGPSNSQSPSERARASAVAEPAGIRDRNVKWLEPAAVRRWIDMGLRGLNFDGSEQSVPGSNRTGTRDAAFAELLYGTGLRVSEAASMLLPELPETHDAERIYRSGRLASSCAKGGHGRQWWCPRDTLGEVWTYVEGQRAEWVRKAQINGRYKDLPGALVATQSPGGGLRFNESRTYLTTQRVTSLDSLDSKTRLRLFIETPRGLEPLAIWLNESGMPRPSHAWQSTFRTGNERLTRAGYPRFNCTPHMLRHSFALRWYSVGRLLWDRRVTSLTQEEQRDFRIQFGDTWQFVQTLLGHRHPQTTANIYLEPFKSLDVQILLEHTAQVPLTELMRLVLRGDDRVTTDIEGTI